MWDVLLVFLRCVVSKVAAAADVTTTGSTSSNTISPRHVLMHAPSLIYHWNGAEIADVRRRWPIEAELCRWLPTASIERLVRAAAGTVNKQSILHLVVYVCEDWQKPTTCECGSPTVGKQPTSSVSWQTTEETLNVLCIWSQNQILSVRGDLTIQRTPILVSQLLQ